MVELAENEIIRVLPVKFWSSYPSRRVKKVRVILSYMLIIKKRKEKSKVNLERREKLCDFLCSNLCRIFRLRGPPNVWGVQF